jgi:hypothetical protein
MKKIWLRKDFKHRKSSCNFGWNQEPNCAILYPKLEKQCRFKVKLNYYWTNLHKN